MKVLLLVLVLITGCATPRMYKAADVVIELKKNSSQLELISFNVENDYADKFSFYEDFRTNSKQKDSFIVQDLAWRLNDLKMRRNEIRNKLSSVKESNDGLMAQLENKNQIKETEPVFEKIDNFPSTTGKKAGELFTDYANYRNASTEFAKFALFTGNVFKKSTSIER